MSKLDRQTDETSKLYTGFSLERFILVKKNQHSILNTNRENHISSMSLRIDRQNKLQSSYSTSQNEKKDKIKNPNLSPEGICNGVFKTNCPTFYSFLCRHLRAEKKQFQLIIFITDIYQGRRGTQSFKFFIHWHKL